jgi:hypothetical protein
MSTTAWHPPADLVARYTAGTIEAALGDSVELHLTACAACRADVTRDADPDGLDEVWRGIPRGVVAPAPGRFVRAMLRLGAPGADVVVVRASSGLYRPWLVAVGGALVAAIVSGSLATAGGRGLDDLTFVVPAPLIPVLAVAAAFDGVDPIRELTAATPHSKLRVALLRALSALVVAVPVTSAVGLAIPGLDRLAFLWLLPGLALCTLTLVLLSWLSAWTAAASAVGVWLCLAAAVSHGSPAAGAAALASPPGQLLAAAAALAGGLVLVTGNRTHRSAGGVFR